MKRLVKVMAALLVAVMALTVVPVSAEAASTNKITAATKIEKATKLKTGTNVVTDKKNDGWIVFVAPKDGKYTFTFSDFVCYKDSKKTALGNVFVYEYKSYKTFKNVSTEGGKTWCMKIASKNYDAKYLNSGKGTDKYLKTRSAKNVSLKKGQKIYFSTYFTANSSKYKVVIKKK